MKSPRKPKARKVRKPKGGKLWKEYPAIVEADENFAALTGEWAWSNTIKANQSEARKLAKWLNAWADWADQKKARK